jgi:hypothetical protein
MTVKSNQCDETYLLQNNKFITDRLYMLEGKTIVACGITGFLGRPLLDALGFYFRLT